MNEEEAKAFFKNYKNASISTDYVYSIEVEELYQAFKARLIAELKEMGIDDKS